MGHLTTRFLTLVKRVPFGHGGKSQGVDKKRDPVDAHLMVTKVTKYLTADGIEFSTHDEAYSHEEKLQRVVSTKALILSTLKKYKDPQGRLLYRFDDATVQTLAEMLVNTTLLTALTTK